jgi:DNA-binding NarL/FixJ family response regulator
MRSTKKYARAVAAVNKPWQADRQQQVLQLMKQGLTRYGIARRLRLVLLIAARN